MPWNKLVLRNGLSAILSITLLLSSVSPAPAEEPKAKTIAMPGKAGESSCIPQDVDYFPDQVYYIRKDMKMTVDVMLPKAGKEPFSAVVCLHGGGWVMGNRKTNLPLMIKLAQSGYVAVSVEFRLAPKDPFPAAVHDVKCAVRWLRANAEVFKVDPDRIAALGYSSGGHLACLLGMTGPKHGLEGSNGHMDRSSRVQLVISYYGIHDLTELYNDKNPLTRYSLTKFLGDSPAKARAQYAMADPISYVCKDAPPILLIHGTADTLVPIKQSQILQGKLKNVGAEVTLLALDGAPHCFEGKFNDKADAAAVQFLDEHFGSKIMKKD